MSKKKELGKGIRALLSNIEEASNPEEKKTLVKKLSNEVMMVNPNDVETNPFQPRKDFDQELLEELSKSINTYGLIQPITVRNMGGNAYQLISGERRLRASIKAGLTEIPAYIRVANDQEMLEMALVENIQRSDLNAMEIAISYQRLMVECQLTHEQLSDRIGKNRSTITNYVRLLKLPPVIQTAIKKGEISMGHARALAGVDDISLQLDIFNEVLKNKLSVRALEKLINSYQSGGSKQSKSVVSTLPTEVLKIKDELSHKLGTKIDIKRENSGKGQIVIKFSSDAEFNNIIDLLTD